MMGRWVGGGGRGGPPVITYLAAQTVRYVVAISIPTRGPQRANAHKIYFTSALFYFFLSLFLVVVLVGRVLMATWL